MTRTALLVNEASGSFSEAMVETLYQQFDNGGCGVAKLFRFPADDWPSPDQLDAERIETMAVCGGDGTVNSLTTKLSGWSGNMLVLAGGTMNLLCKRLHGHDENERIIADYCAGRYRAAPIDIVRLPQADALIGVIAGPTAAWSDVREAMRSVDLGGLAEAVPNALGETFDGNKVHLQGSDVTYPALFATSEDGRMRLSGFRAGGVGEVFAHGIAWLSGDFREGPHDDLGECSEAVIVNSNASDPVLPLLVDGEAHEARSPCPLHLAQSDVAFIRAGT